MLHCPNCNAPIQTDVEVCPFCGTLTDYGVRAREERTRREEEEARKARQTAEQRSRSERIQALAEAARSANRSLMWSLFGLLVCCLPLGPIIGIATARKARELAEKNGAPTAHATGALVVGVVSLVMSVLSWGAIGLVGKLEADRKAALTAIIAKGDTNPTLDLTTACALTELEVINSKYEGYEHINHDLSCGTRLEQRNDDARLLDAHFTKDEKRVPVVACFHRVSGRWGISQVRGDERCDEPPSR